MKITRQKEDQNFWNFVFSLFFLVVLAGAGSLLQVAANGIGWRAEGLKRSVEQL